MTHEDAVEALAEVMREAGAAHMRKRNGATLLDCIRVGLVAALAPENRETVLAALGMRRSIADPECESCNGTGWNPTHVVPTDCCDCRPVYVYRGNP